MESTTESNTEVMNQREGFSPIGHGDIEKFISKHKGDVLRPSDDGYDQAREIWNAMIDKHPAMIARCKDVADIRLCMDLVRTQGLDFSVRGGGHNIAGNAVCDRGLMIDLSGMNKVTVDERNRRAYVEPGATLGDFDRAAQKHGLATPLGINSTTGVAGLTLGGGFGWLTRKFGLSIDNLISVNVVTADGRMMTASENENADLFWALRGGGGNFGIVTNFEFALHPVGPEVLSGMIVFSGDQLEQVMTAYRNYMVAAPEELNVWAIVRKAPPLPFLPKEMHGKEVVALAVFYLGDPETGKRLIEPIRGFGQAVGEHVGLQPYVEWQTVFDPLLTFGARNYWKSHNFRSLNDDAIGVIENYASKLPSEDSEIFIGLLGGEANRVSQDATAYPHRDANFVMNVHGRWHEPSQDEKVIQWARDFFKDAAPFATGGVYVNFLTQDEKERIPSAYGRSLDRLREIKAKYDPENMFRLNQNIRPASSAH